MAHVVLLLILPFAIQASALVAENIAVTLVVLDTLQVHIENFILELDQYLLVLAVNHGTLPEWGDDGGNSYNSGGAGSAGGPKSPK